MLRCTLAVSATAAVRARVAMAASWTSARTAHTAAAASVMDGLRRQRGAPAQSLFASHRTALTTSLLVRAYATASNTGSADHAEAHDPHSNGAAAAAVGPAAERLEDAAPMHAPTLRSALPPSAVELPEESFLKCIDKEILDEQLRLDKEEGPPPVPVGWTMHHTDSTSFIYGRRLWMPPPSPSPAPSSGAPADGAAQRENTQQQQQGSHGDGGAADAAQRPAYDATPVPRVMERHFLRIQLTARDASLDPECDVRGEHFPFSFFVQRVRGGDGDADADVGGAADALRGDPFEEHSFFHDSIEARCDVVEGELIVDAVVHHGPATTPSSPSSSSSSSPAPVYTNPFGGYPGPNLDEAEEEVLDGIQSWLAERGVDDQLAEFVGQYSIWVEQAEYERWLQQLRDYVAA